jgi:hypothetical protein
MEKHMYTVYKITNQTNQKFYIGVHKTNDPYDSYMGSGIAIKNAIKKYGRDSFTKEILLLTESKDEAYTKERELTVDYDKSSNYNMKLGGVGGFTKENARKGNVAALKKLTKEQLSANGKKGYLKANINPVEVGRKGGLANKGKILTEEHKQKIRDALKGRSYAANPEIVEKVKQLRSQGLTSKEIGAIVKMSRNTVMKYWK